MLAPTLPVPWFVETLTEAFAREIRAGELHDWLRRAVETLRLRAVVVTSTEDQVAGLVRELREDFGLTADGVVASSLADGSAQSALLRRADVLIVTAAHVTLVERIAGEIGKPVIAIDVRPDLVAGEWAMLLRQPVWAIVASQEFGDMLRAFFANVRGIENLTILVHGRDDLTTIPEDAPTYVTGRVREALGRTPIRGRVLPPARTIAIESARAIFEFIVRSNLRAAQALDAAAPPPSTPRHA